MILNEQNVGKWVKDVIVAQGEIKEIANKSGFTDSLVFFWANGKNLPRTFTLGLVLETIGYKAYVNGKEFDLLDVTNEFNKMIGNQTMLSFSKQKGISYDAVRRIMTKNNVRFDCFMKLLNDMGYQLEVKKAVC